MTAGEVLSMAETFIEQQIHPTVIISAYRQALDDIVEAARKIRLGSSKFICYARKKHTAYVQLIVIRMYIFDSNPVDVNDMELMGSIVKTTIGTKFILVPLISTYHLSPAGLTGDMGVSVLYINSNNRLKVQPVKTDHM